MRHIFYDIISIENLLSSWQEFLRGKRKKRDVCKFSLCLMDNIFDLRRGLEDKSYRHGPYHGFNINDPKPRIIHKASVRDRLVHRAIYRILYPHFDRKFIFDSFSCRNGKGVHRAINRFRDYARIVSRNHSRTAWILQGDIKKFFANINHRILLNILKKQISDKETVWLLDEVIGSFHAPGRPGVGLPLGNLTSQLLVNVYMNAFDHFLKRDLKIIHCVRYADDFVILHEDKKYLINILPKISGFLKERLGLLLHPNKIFIKTFASGVDFLGWINFPNHAVLRTKTKKRMLKCLRKNASPESLASYLGLLRHGNTYGLRDIISRDIFIKYNFFNNYDWHI